MSAAAGLLTVLARAGIPHDHWSVAAGSPNALPLHRLVVADDPTAFEPFEDATVAVVPLGTAGAAPRFAVAMAGAVPMVVRAEVEAIAERSSRDRPLAPVAGDVGRLLHLLCRARRARRVLDIGAGAGTATLWMAAALRQPGGRLTAIERDSALRTIATGAVGRAGLAGAVDLRLGDASRLIDALDGRFDVVLFDEAATEREGHLLQLLEGGHVGSRALLCSHGGRREPAALARLHAQLQVRPEIVASTSLGVGDGLFVAVAAGAPQV